jgi:hypothetical protein
MHRLRRWRSELEKLVKEKEQNVPMDVIPLNAVPLTGISTTTTTGEIPSAIQ